MITNKTELETALDSKKIITNKSELLSSLNTLSITKQTAMKELLAYDTYKQNITPLDYQKKNVLKILQQFPNKILIADEVGLGKTIETAMLIKELLHRKIIKKVLILVPAPLKYQWQLELKEKFEEEFVIADSPSIYQDHDKIIASIDTAKQDNHKEKIQSIVWDMIVLDEAHKYKNPNTKNYKLIKDIDTKRICMLTATPIQNNIFELFAIMNLLEPGLLGTKSIFEKSFVKDDKGLQVKNHDKLKEKLDKVMIRTLRKDTNIKFKKRIVKTHYIPFKQEEERWYHDVMGFVKKRYQHIQNASKQSSQKDATLDSEEEAEFQISQEDLKKQARIYQQKGLLTFSLIMLTRQITSAKQTGVKALKRYQENLEDNDEKKQVQEIIDQSSMLPQDSKLEKLLKILKSIKKDKAIIFTTFVHTQKLLEMELKLQGYSVAIFNGSQNPIQKESTIQEFKNDKQILICTDAGSEGRNLQFAHILINYDLPWNPMRVEQRIGRVHRIGQEKDVIIHNMAIQNTIEGYILNRLYEKIKLFEVSIGEMDLVLSQLDSSTKSLDERMFEEYLESVISKDVKESKSVKDATSAKSKKSIFNEITNAKQKVEQIHTFDSEVFSDAKN